MASVRIGEKDLEVKPATLGFLKRKLIPAQRALAKARTEEETLDAVAALIFLYVDHNKGIRLEFILDNVVDAAAVLRACAAAAGQRVPEGEAKSQ